MGYSTGNELQNEFTYKNGTYVIITNEDNDLSYLLIPFVCVVSICFIIAISIFVSYFNFWNLFKILQNFNYFILFLNLMPDC